MTILAWRYVVQAFDLHEKKRRARLAWQVYWSLLAAGAKGDDVSYEALLAQLEGRKPRQTTVKQRIAQDPVIRKQKQVERMMARLRHDREKG